MPRGNDPEAARELAERFQNAPNAEDLIASNRLRRSRALATAALLPIDEDATDDLDLKKVASEAGEDQVLSAAVRGGYVVYVAEADDGRLYKGAYATKGSAAEKREAREPDADPDVVAHFQSEAEVAKAAREAQEEAAEKAEEARQKAAEDAGKKVQAAQKSAAKAADRG